MPTISIVAVHGTFATDAPWTKPNSPFAVMLENEFPSYRVKWHFFNWSGANTHTARETAANSLQQKLEEITSSGEENLHVIGHSHGGNVALMSLCAPNQHRNAVQSVTCLSTPFFVATANDIEYLLESAFGALRLKPLFLLSLLYFATLEFLSNLIPGITAIGMFLYLALLILSAITLAAVYIARRRGKFSQQQLLDRYNYSRISQPILSLRASLDEAFHLLNVNALVAGAPTALYWLVVVTLLIGVPLALFIGWAFVIPLVILAPLIYVSGQGVRFLVRSAPWAMGEGLLHSVLVDFATKNQLSHANVKNVEIKVSAAETHRQFKLRHSALYSSPTAVKEIAAFIRASGG